MDHAVKHGDKTVQRHINRYKWAASHIARGARVFHAGCGSGYGDHILLERAGNVVAVDVSEEALVYAREKARRVKPNAGRLSYAKADLGTMDAAAWTVPFDAVVCIEVIEHLRQDAQAHFIKQMGKLLSTDGALLITTPIAAGPAKMTPFHEHEFTQDEFTAYLSQGFLYVQYDNPKRFGVADDFLLAKCWGVK